MASTVLAYWPAINAGFIWDDESYVTENPLLRSWEGLKDIWIPGHTPQYYPVVFSTFWIEYQLWELKPLGYHLVNILLHAGNALLVWRLAWVLGLGRSDARNTAQSTNEDPRSNVTAFAAWTLAIVFALHPVHVESVAWITERKNVLSGLFYLAAALTYLRFDGLRNESKESRSEESWGWYGTSLLLFVLALLSKTVTCSLPAAMILMLLWQRRPLSAPRLMPLAPMFIIGAGLAWHTALLERSHVGAHGSEFDFSVADRFLIASKALLFYPWKLLWPAELIFIYPRWVIDDNDWRQFWSVAVVLMATLGAVWMYLRGWRGLPLALAFYAGTIFPALGFINVYPMIFSFVADHFQYLASLGVLAAIIGSLAWLVPSARVMLGAGAALMIILGVLTFNQARMYSDIEALWRVTLSRNSMAWMPHNNLSELMLGKARDAQDSQNLELVQDLAEQAREHASAALAIKPNHASAYSNLSEALRLLQRNEEALAAALRNAELAPHIADNHYMIARLQQLVGQPEPAEAAYERALEIDAHHLESRIELALLLLNLEKYDEALPHIDAAVTQNPNDVRFALVAGQRLDRAGRHADALRCFRRAYEAAPEGAPKADAGYFLAQMLAMCADPEFRNAPEAVEIAQQVAALTGRQNPYVLGLLAAAYAETGRLAEALSTAEEAHAISRSMGHEALTNELQTKMNEYRDRSHR